jgi:pimeloyl-ACP methyl ester carboxylesterase
VAGDWELYESGPPDADRVALLLPGGLTRARSYEELMAQPALQGIRLVAATLPGHGGTTPADDLSIETTAASAAKLASDIQCDVVLGFSIGATVAYEMVTSGAYSAPVVLVGISLSLQDEAMFLRVFDKLGVVTGSVPFSAMRQMMGSMMKRVQLPEARKAELLDDLRKNDARVMRKILRAYLQYLGREPSPATRLCDAGVPAWVVHAETGGDGGLTDAERTTLEACGNVTVETIPGSSFLLPNEEPERIAAILAAAFPAR